MKGDSFSDCVLILVCLALVCCVGISIDFKEIELTFIEIQSESARIALFAVILCLYLNAFRWTNFVDDSHFSCTIHLIGPFRWSRELYLSEKCVADEGDIASFRRIVSIINSSKLNSCSNS